MAPSTSAPFEVEHDAAAPGFFSSMAAFFLPTKKYQEAADAQGTRRGARQGRRRGQGRQCRGERGEGGRRGRGGSVGRGRRGGRGRAGRQCEEGECKAPAKHFKHCSEKVEAGEGWHGEDCVEELFHLMHCVDGCAAPKVFKKLA